MSGLRGTGRRRLDKILDGRIAKEWSSRARAEVPYGHPRPQHGRRPRPAAGRPASRARTSASRSSRSPTASPSSSPATPTSSRSAGSSPRRSSAAGGIPREFNTIAVDDGIAMGHGGMLYSPAVPRPDRRLRRVHGRGALRRRPDLHLQLRQDHPRHADGRPAAQHPDRLRLRRPDGGRQGDPRRRHGPQARPDQRHLGRRQRERLGRGHRSASRRTPARPAAPAPACSPPTR